MKYPRTVSEIGDQTSGTRSTDSKNKKKSSEPEIENLPFQNKIQKLYAIIVVVKDKTRLPRKIRRVSMNL